MKIVIATGGTGGHIFPALQTARVLKGHGHEIIFVGVLGLGKAKIEAEGFESVLIQAQGLTDRSPLGLLRFSLSMLKALNQAGRVLDLKSPQRVIGFGGYSSFAVVLCAWWRRIPVMIHEQNVIPGKANRWLARIVKRIAISFHETSRYLDPSKTIWTGCPCHQTKPGASRKELLEKFSLDPSKLTILVLGGSQGSQKLNQIVFEMASSLLEPSGWQLIHMTGAKQFLEYQQHYKNSLVKTSVYDFISPIEEAYSVCDVAVARAGASTVCELGFFMVPSILVPYPLADGHQNYNAIVLADTGAARIVEQKDLSALKLKQEIETVLGQTKNSKDWQAKSKVLFDHSPAQKLALAIENL